jgi:hypothetical protein
MHSVGLIWHSSFVMHLSTCSIGRAFFAKERLELREGLLDWVQIRPIRWQEKQFRTRRSDRRPHGFAFVTAQVIHHDNVSWAQISHQELDHPAQKDLAVDRCIEDARRGDAVKAQSRNEGQRLAMTLRHLSN